MAGESVETADGTLIAAHLARVDWRRVYTLDTRRYAPNYLPASVADRLPWHGFAMEDAATAEIARCQIWQWIHHGTPLAGGGRVTADLVRSMLDEELAALGLDRAPGDQGRLSEAAAILTGGALGEDLRRSSPPRRTPGISSANPFRRPAASFQAAPACATFS